MIGEAKAVPGSYATGNIIIIRHIHVHRKTRNINTDEDYFVIMGVTSQDTQLSGRFVVQYLTVSNYSNILTCLSTSSQHQKSSFLPEHQHANCKL